MIDQDNFNLILIIMGILVITSGVVEAGLRRVNVPPLVGYLLLGLSLSIADSRWHLLSHTAFRIMDFLADFGVIAILFRIGLDSHPRRLARKINQAMHIVPGDLAATAVCVLIAAYYVLNLQLFSALIVATALLATSVGVSLAAWRGAGALHSDNGNLLLDVAELGDIAAVLLMALLFALLPVVHDHSGAMWPALTEAFLLFSGKFALFLGACYLFSRYVERHLTHAVVRIELPPQRMLMITSIAMIIAALGAIFGLSLTIGALLAGLMFSRDPEAVKAERSFRYLYALVTPFFFINIGLQIQPDHLGGGLLLGLALLAAAAVGKFIGVGIPALLMSDARSAVLLGGSMMPRAEITMVVMGEGRRVGDWVVSDQVYTAVMLVIVITCLVTPLLLEVLLRRWSQADPAETPR